MEAGEAAAVRARHGASVIAEEGCRLLYLDGASLLRHLPRAVLGAMAGAARERGMVRDALVQEAARQRLERRRRLALEASYASSMESLSASIDAAAAAAAPRPPLVGPPPSKAAALSRHRGAASSAAASGAASRDPSPTVRRAMTRRALPTEGQPAPRPAPLPSSLPSAAAATAAAAAAAAAASATAAAAAAASAAASAYGAPLVRCATAPYAAHGLARPVTSPGTPLRRRGMGAPSSLAPEQLRRHNSLRTLRTLRTAALSAPRLPPAHARSPRAAPAPAARLETPPPPGGPPPALQPPSRDTAVWSSLVSTPLSFGGRGKGKGKGASAGTLPCWDAATLDAKGGGLDLAGLVEVRRLFLQLEQNDATATQKLKAQEQAGRRPRFEDDALGFGMA